MKILVIGSGGFIGSNCVKYFSKRHSVFTAGVKKSPFNLPHVILSSTGNNFENLFIDKHFDVCINATGSANVSFSFEYPEIDYELNVLNVHKILLAIRKYNSNCKFINFSSAAVYGNPSKLPISENNILNPLSPYGFHKLQSESLLTEYHKFFGLHTCSLRVFSGYGMGLKKQLFWDLYKKAFIKQPLHLYGTGNETRDFIFINDLLLSIDLIIENGRFCGEVINIATGVETKIKDAVANFFHIYDKRIEYKFSGEQKPGDPHNWQADISLIKSMGFISKYNLTSGLTLYINWLKNLS